MSVPHRPSSPFGQPTRTSSPTPISNQNLNYNRTGSSGSFGSGNYDNQPGQYGPSTDRFGSSSDRYGSPDRFNSTVDRYGNQDRYGRDDRFSSTSLQLYDPYRPGSRYDTFGHYNNYYNQGTASFGGNRIQTYRYGPSFYGWQGGYGSSSDRNRTTNETGNTNFSFSRGLPRIDGRNWARSLMNRFNIENDRRRRFEQPMHSMIMSTIGGSSGTSTATAPFTHGQEPIKVELTEFYARDNAKEHHTEMYELVTDNPPTPVLRRGQNFFLAVRFDRAFDQQRDTVRVSFGYGPKPTVTKGTRVILPVTHQHDSLGHSDRLRWNMNIHRQDGNTITLQVYIPATAQVGIWHCTIETSRQGHREFRYDYECEDDIYILFNPWCRDDSVYMENEVQRREYILNETGKIWCGSYRNPKGRRWVYGQFDDVVLPAAMYLLEQSNLAHPDRGSPVQVVRAISAVVSAFSRSNRNMFSYYKNKPDRNVFHKINSLDDSGLLEARWDGQYHDGTNPSAWTGTVAIMERYLQEGGRPVKYGQCWVFSAATVTICRALGIPCRSVTNYVSAHDTNRSLTVDKYFDRDGNEIYHGPDGDCNDSCWNFHVWNDVWMTRPDLPPGYGGWQVIDPTPQEESDNMYRCGPASLEAIRRGEVGFAYDTPFVFSEINADVCHFQEDDNSDWGFSRLSINQYHVGRKIVTKRVDRDDDEGDNDLQDITVEYKNPEGSNDQRLAVFNAVRGVSRAQQYYDYPDNIHEDVFFDLVDIEYIPYGQSFDVIVNIHNKSNDIRTIQAVLNCQSVYYTGTTACRLKRAQGEFVVRPNQREVLKIHVSPNEYLDKLVDQSLIKIYALATVKETKQTWSEEDDFHLMKPRMSVQIRGSPRIGQECHATFSFQNPLNVPLTECYFTVEGPGLQRPRRVRYRDVRPGELVSYTELFTPRRHGERKIVCTFTSRQLSDVTGSQTVLVHQ